MKLSVFIFILSLVGGVAQRNGFGNGGGGNGGGGNGGRGNGGGGGGGGAGGTGAGGTGTGGTGAGGTGTGGTGTGGTGGGTGGVTGGGTGGGTGTGDTVPPVIVSRNTRDGDVIGSQNYEMIAEVTDNVGVQGVSFRVTSPSGNTIDYQGVRTGTTSVFTAQVLFDVGGSYSSRVVARDTSGNNARSATISFLVESGDFEPVVFTSAEEIISLADARIRAAIARNRRIAATILRLSFHDCVPNGVAGGCDGCVNLANPANNGLLPAIQALAPIVTELESEDFGVSRADLWAYAALVASDVSQNNLVFTDEFSIGRQNCETVGTCSSTDPLVCATNGPDQFGDFPSNDLTTHQLLDFMNEHFGFNADETVAIMGAHTIGRALPQNSGFQGQNGWSNNVFSLDNEYYAQIVGNPVLANAPDWTQIQVRPSNLFQWIRGGGGGGGGGAAGAAAGGGGGGGGGGVPLFMLNADIALVRDLGVDNDLQADGRALCTFRNPLATRCPLSETLTSAGIYRNDNAAWLADFKEALNIMIEKGLF